MYNCFLLLLLTFRVRMEKTGLWGKEEKRENRWLLYLLTWHSSLGGHTSKRTELFKEFKMSVTRKIFVMSYEAVQI